MESPLALYRRYRPETFAEVIGQEHVTEPLRAALANNRVNHAYLFSGPRGCGKTTSRPDPGPRAQLRAGADRRPVRRVRQLQGPGPRRAGLHRRHRDRRGLPRWCRRRPRPAREGVLRAGAQPLQGLHHRRGPHGHDAGLQRPAQAGRGAAAAPAVHLRDHRARQGAADDPVAHPPLPVPADPAAAALVVPLRALRQGGRHDRAGGAAAGGPRGRRLRARHACPCSTSCSAAPGRRASPTTSRPGCSATPPTPCSTTSSTRSRPATARPCSAWSTRSIETGQDPRRFTEDLLRRLRDLVIVAAVPDAPATGLIDVLRGPGRAAGRPGRPVRAGRAQPRRRHRRLRADRDARRHRAPPAARAALRPGAAARRRRRHRRRAGPPRPAREAGVDQRRHADADRRRPGAARPGPPGPARRPAAPRRTRPRPVGRASRARREPAPEPVVERPSPSRASSEPPHPEPSPSAAPAAGRPAAASGGLTLVDVRRLWPDIVEATKGVRRLAWMHLTQNCQVVAVEGNTLTLGLRQRRRPRLLRERRLRRRCCARPRSTWSARTGRSTRSSTPSAQPEGTPTVTKAATRRPEPAASRAAPDARHRRRRADRQPAGDAEPSARRPSSQRRRPRGDPADPLGRRGPAPDRPDWAAADADAHPDDLDAEHQGISATELLQRELGAR